jgi:hypothetical protein
MGLGERGTWGKGGLESGKRKVGTCLWLIVKLRKRIEKYFFSLCGNRKFTGYFKYLVMGCIYGQALKTKKGFPIWESFFVLQI